MTQQSINAVQYSMNFTGVVTFANQGTGNEAYIDVPSGFLLNSGAIVVTQVFNGTTPSASIVDNMATPNTLVAATALTALGPTLLATPKQLTYYPAGGRLTIALTGTGSTAGAVAVIIQGVVLGRQNERIGS